MPQMCALYFFVFYAKPMGSMIRSDDTKSLLKLHIYLLALWWIECYSAQKIHELQVTLVSSHKSHDITHHSEWNFKITSTDLWHIKILNCDTKVSQLGIKFQNYLDRFVTPLRFSIVTLTSHNFYLMKCKITYCQHESPQGWNIEQEY
jgi:hypothetical protein